ncbi:MAG: hypothetical protein ACR2O6_08925 [Ilumatobacteraceae bacterium]
MTSEWYWDLRRSQAVPADERGAAEDMLGPYPSKYEAEHWKDKVDERNQAWDDDDEAWEEGETDG